jgi:hypothetical protein
MSLFELTLEFSGFPFKRAEQDYLQIQSLDPKAFDYWQLCQRLRMVKHHLDHSPFYQNLIGSAQKDELVRRLSENPQANIRRIVMGRHDHRNTRLSHRSVGFFFAA